MAESEVIWLFHAEGAAFAGATFTSLQLAESWILQYSLSGLLTAYPVNKSVYDWAIEKNFYKPKADKKTSSSFIGGFTSASQEHFHYQSGIRQA